MNTANWLVTIFGIPVVLGTAWQIWRDIKKDRADQVRDAAERVQAQIREAAAQAREETLHEERLRRLEGRPADDDH